jgi:3-mercaptopyruvate sulfurtransferase SseA
MLSCVQKPTKIIVNDEYRNKIYAPLIKGSLEPLVIKSETIIIDARSTFSYTTGHIPGSISLSWTEFSLHRSKKPGRLRKNTKAMVKRLARLGITPGTPLIIVDKGLFGNGEAGRLAWTFYYLGVRNIQVANIKALKSKLTIKESLAIKPKNYWAPNVHQQILITRKELNKLDLNTDPLSGNNIIMDVRSEKEFAASHNNSAINIQWSEFYNKSGRPDINFRKKLQQIGIHENKKIIVVSNKGVRSAAVTMALLSMGYSSVRNFTESLH